MVFLRNEEINDENQNGGEKNEAGLGGAQPPTAVPRGKDTRIVSP